MYQEFQPNIWPSVSPNLYQKAPLFSHFSFLWQTAAEVWTGAMVLHGCFLKILILPKIGLWLWANDLLNLGMLKFEFLKWAIMVGLLWGLGASLIAQLINHLPAVQETWVWFLGQKDPMEKEMATHSSILAWRITSTEEPGGLTVHGVARVGHDLVTKPHYCED